MKLMRLILLMIKAQMRVVDMVVLKRLLKLKIL